MVRRGSTCVRKRKQMVTLCVLAAYLCFCLPGALAKDLTLRGYLAGQGWQYVTLGNFPQTLEGGVEPIVWRVLSVTQHSAYLVSEYVLCHRRLEPDDALYVLNGGAFEKTEMYAYLNGAFLQSFQEDELALLQVTDGARVTLLTADDLRNRAYGFGTDVSRGAYGTPYALNHGLYQYPMEKGNTSPYWTRTQNETNTYAAICTKADGNLGWIRVVVQNEGCRPACTLALQNVRISGGDGTLSNPYQVSKMESRAK